MRRLALLVAGGALWLLLAAFPVLADGGPHQLAVNSGTAGLSGDCAACHRAHTAQAADLLKAPMPGLCTNCHNGSGATTDVIDGVQYLPNGSGDPTTTMLGALRGGGFTYALLDSSKAARIFNTRPIQARGHVSVLAASARQPVTSTHGGAGATVWGNGAIGTAGAGATGVVLDCAKCHNPHGNGQYRILNTLPGEDWVNGVNGVAGWTTPTNAVEVQDGPALAGSQVRNYSVLPGNLTSDVVTAGYTAIQGDYWRRNVPAWNTSTSRDAMLTGWNGSSPTNAAASGGAPLNNFNGLMTAWCVSCHTRYNGLPNVQAGLPSDAYPSGDATFSYRHDTTNVGCEQCHVSHGSNALMTAQFSNIGPDPAGAVPTAVPGAGPATSPVTSGDSRLLKVDNRGTCQMCHDPTQTVSSGTYSGPSPSPSAP